MVHWYKRRIQGYQMAKNKKIEQKSSALPLVSNQSAKSTIDIDTSFWFLTCILLLYCVCLFLIGSFNIIYIHAYKHTDYQVHGQFLGFCHLEITFSALKSTFTFYSRICCFHSDHCYVVFLQQLLLVWCFDRSTGPKYGEPQTPSPPHTESRRKNIEAKPSLKQMMPAAMDHGNILRYSDGIDCLFWRNRKPFRRVAKRRAEVESLSPFFHIQW